MADKLASWVKRISDQELPIFKYTINAITDVVASEDTSTAELAQIILRDASLTARILRIANSPLYNASSTAISTVSRAVVYVGFNLVRDISLSLAVIEALLGENAKEHTLRLMARSFHAAVLAKMLAEHRGDDRAEEIFIAALLRSLGEMAFWCITSDDGKEILELQQQGCKPIMAQREVLGFGFDQLTVALTHDWHLSDLLHSAINQPELPNARIKDIVYSRELADAFDGDWQSKKIKQCSHNIARHIQLDNNECNEFLIDAAQHTTELAQLFGASAIIKYLPNPTAPTENIQDSLPEFPEPSAELQLNILRDLTVMIDSHPNLNLVLEALLEGIYRGVGMDRTLLALLSPDKKQFIGKYALGKNNTAFSQAFQLPLIDNPILTDILQDKHAVWVKDAQSGDDARRISHEMRVTLASQAFFISPVCVNQRPIGIVYSDRQPSDRPLDQESFESFRHFCIQANLIISQIT